LYADSSAVQCSITIVHRFTSPEWLRCLRLHLAALSDIEEETAKNPKAKVMNIFNLIVKLRIGEALLFAPGAAIDVEKSEHGENSVKRLGTGYLKIKVRARITEDGGKSVMANAPKKSTFGRTKIVPSGSIFGASTAPPRTPIFDNLVLSTPSAPFSAFSNTSTNNLFAFNRTVFDPKQATFGAGATNAVPPTVTSPSVASLMPVAQSTQDKASVTKSSQSSGPAAQPNQDTNSFGGIFKTATSKSKHVPGTMFIPFKPFVEIEIGEREEKPKFVAFQHLCFQGAYTDFSPEELRLGDYCKGERGKVSKAN
jgi:hypothetical protein